MSRTGSFLVEARSLFEYQAALRDERCGLCVTPSGSASPHRCGLLHPAIASHRSLGDVGSNLRPLQRALAQARPSAFEHIPPRAGTTSIRS